MSHQFVGRTQEGDNHNCFIRLLLGVHLQARSLVTLILDDSVNSI